MRTTIIRCLCLLCWMSHRSRLISGGWRELARYASTVPRLSARLVALFGWEWDLARVTWPQLASSMQSLAINRNSPYKGDDPSSSFPHPHSHLIQPCRPRSTPSPTCRTRTTLSSRTSPSRSWSSTTRSTIRLTSAPSMLRSRRTQRLPPPRNASPSKRP